MARRLLKPTFAGQYSAGNQKQKTLRRRRIIVIWFMVGINIIAYVLSHMAGVDIASDD
jgi:hypothetical protein